MSEPFYDYQGAICGPKKVGKRSILEAYGAEKDSHFKN